MVFDFLGPTVFLRIFVIVQTEFQISKPLGIKQNEPNNLLILCIVAFFPPLELYCMNGSSWI